MKKFFPSLALTGVMCLVFAVTVAAQQVANNSIKKSAQLYSWQFTGDYAISANPAEWVTIAVDNWNQPYVCYADVPGTLNVNVLTFDNNTWSQVGQAGFTSGTFVSMALDNLGVPHVALCENHHPMVDQTSVMVYNGVNWVYLGNEWFSAGNSYHTSIDISPTGQSYVVYQDAANSSKLSVMKYDGSWTNVGPAGFSAGFSRNPVIKFSPAAEPYVAFQDWANNGKATVMKYNGSAWALVGNAGFSPGEMDSISLAFSPAGEPYVAFSDKVNSWKATVMKYNGSQWVNVGTPGFSAGAAGWTSIVVRDMGKPVVGYQDAGNSLKATVMEFDGSQWGNVGEPGFSAGTVKCTSLASAPNGKIYLAFADGANSNKVTVMEYSDFTRINETTDPAFSVYPDPVSDILNIRFSDSGNSSKTIHIIDSGGKEVLNTICNTNKLQVNVSNYPSGIYCIHVNAAGESSCSKFLRE